MRTNVRLKTKIIKSDNDYWFTKEVDDFLSDLEPDDVIDIQYEVYNQVYFSAMIIYKVSI